MAVSPPYKVYDANEEYMAACKELEAAAALAAFYGPGASIRPHHKKAAWTEGIDGVASESYDFVVETIRSRQRIPHR